MHTATKPVKKTVKGRPTKIQQLEKECDEQQTMIDQARKFAEITGGLTKEFEQRLQVSQLDLDSKRLLIEFKKKIGG